MRAKYIIVILKNHILTLPFRFSDHPLVTFSFGILSALDSAIWDTSFSHFYFDFDTVLFA